MKRVRVAKLLRANLTTRGGYDWSTPGKIHRFTGAGKLCGPGHAHVYTTPALALWLRPLHVDETYCRLFPGEGVVSGTDRGLKLGVRELVLDLDHEIVLTSDAPRPEACVTAAIMASLVVYPGVAYRCWATAWLGGMRDACLAAQTLYALSLAEMESIPIAAQVAARTATRAAVALATGTAEVWRLSATAAWTAAAAAEVWRLSALDLEAIADAAHILASCQRPELIGERNE